MKLLSSAALLIILVASACRRPISTVANKFADTVFVRIRDFQDRRLSDSLYQYFASENAGYRRDAVLAFASIQDSTGVDRIGELLLKDGTAAVRMAAAFALGQTPCDQSEWILLKASGKEQDKVVLREILESYGKVTKNWKLELSPYDSLSEGGLAWSFYRSGLNGLGDSALNAKAASLLQASFDVSARLGAAHYFARGAKDIEEFQQVIIQSAQQDISDNVRMASTLALRKIKTDSSRIAAEQILQRDKDPRVRINAIRSLQSFPPEQFKQFLIEVIHGDNVNLGIAASEVIKTSAPTGPWKDLAPLARTTKIWRIQANLYEAALAGTDGKELVEEIEAAYSNVTDPYHKAALLIALQHSIQSFGFLQEQLFNSNVPVIRSSAATALVAMNHGKNVNSLLWKSFASLYVKAVNIGDPAVIGIVAGALGDSSLGYRKEISDFSFLYDARKKLSLPRDNEANQPLEAAIAYFEGKRFALPVKNEFNHPIDWRLVKGIPREQKAIITTQKGKITIRLFVEEAPGSVANFVALVNRHYFDNKVFHRVVPNFVVQAGCNRGDGWGSEDYSIRSEFSERRYKTGSMGMASSGKDTEGTQWFITHSPTPHLDGRYTIFAEVETGMEVVSQIEVGDKILKIELK